MPLTSTGGISLTSAAPAKKIHRREIRLLLRTNMPDLARQRGRRLSVVADAVLRLLGEFMQAGIINTSAIRALAKSILRNELERDEIARADRGEYNSEEIARRVQVELDAIVAIENAIRHNRLDIARVVIERAIMVGLPVPAAGAPEHNYLARLVLRGLPRNHRVNAVREQNPYDDDLEDVMSPMPPNSMPAGTPSGSPAPAAEDRPIMVVSPTAPIPTNMLAQMAVQSASVAVPEASIDIVEPGTSPLPDPKEAAAHPRPQQPQPAAVARVPMLVTALPVMATTHPLGLSASIVEPASEAAEAVSLRQPPEASPATDWTIEQAMAECVRRRQRASTPFGSAPLCREEERNYRVAAELFASLVEDRRAIDVTEEDLLRFKSELHRVPNLFGRGIYRNLSGAEAVAKADAIAASQQAAVMRRAESGQIDRDNLAHEMRDAEVPRLSMKTVNKHLDKIKGLLKWLRTTMKVVAIDRDLLDLKIRYNKKEIGRAANADREAFSSKEIRQLFASPCWTGCAGMHYRHRHGLNTVKDAKFWIPLLGVLAGVRLGEASQLLTTDIQLRCFDQEDFTDWDVDLDDPSGPWTRLRRFSPKDTDGVPTMGIWCIDVIPDEGKKVKTVPSKRILPIHPLLLELGFLDYVAAQKRAGKRDLFPGLRPEKATRAGENLGEWFSRYLVYIGIKRERLSFHSLRHTFDTHLLNREIPDVRVSELMGHAQQGQTRNRYYKGARLAKLTEAIASINFRLHAGMVDGQLCLVPPPGA